MPICLIHAGVTAAFLPSTAGIESRSQRMEAWSKILEGSAQTGTLDSAEAQRAQQQVISDLGANAAEAGGALILTGIGLFLLSMLLLVPLTTLGIFFGIAAVIPLVDDRSKGGSMTPVAAWGQVGRHAAPLFLTSIIASFAVTVGLFFLVVPGLVLAFLFAFAAPVVMLENKGGVAALKRSLSLVVANLVPTFVVLLVIVLLALVASVLVWLVLPRAWVFLHTLVQALLSVIIFPLPVIGLVLVYRIAREPNARPVLAQPLVPQHS